MSPASSQIEAEAARRGRERRCIATQEVLPETQLIRFALRPDGIVVPDVAAKLPGRGAWVRASRKHIEQAAAKGAFSRAFKAPAKAAADLADQTARLLRQRCLANLGLIRRAGAIALGATQVEAAIRARPVLLLIEASDGAAEGREKLMRLHIGLWSRPPALVGCFDQAELGVALGRERVIHACLLQERLASAWAAEIGRLAGFHAIVPGSWPDSWRSNGWGLGGADADESQPRTLHTNFGDA
ncbi:MAG: RNA-binding protein [Hyphomonadaceae bacterium]|nr:RNA-binding protein [Hyphomonadaceae bacterium]